MIVFNARVMKCSSSDDTTSMTEAERFQSLVSNVSRETKQKYADECDVNLTL